MPEPADGPRRRPSRRYGGIDAEARMAARREQLLRAGFELFGTRGVLSTGVKDICRAAGLTDRYFYESFAGTRELFVTVFDAVVAELFEAVAAAVAAEPAAGDRKLRAGIGTFLEALAADRRKLRIVFAEPASAQAEGHMRESLRRFAALVAETARRARPDAAPAATVEVYSHAVVGMLQQVITEKQEGHLTLPMTDLVEHCTALAAAGLRALYAGEMTENRD
ncbi:TetR/AcrR family transcriptional regulator [Nocardia sp. CDC159]|uniref:TetR/AcrR family transcriptional regulator n=1 Tax=Nocardia pulmonis TaxID=2951408 RepID=A0A9X2ECX1_9NOCA|nr:MULTISPECIES: TetR/AcrR family transcriptional regulator [Nocardia]MCM6778529.1 TetR/AcrR family transcriptional regulator [Nocardia pulmonis]MCM6791418.1 TetR/AcrR family transcriptional regulator [Nocardia sp. CDC159]